MIHLKYSASALTNPTRLRSVLLLAFIIGVIMMAGGCASTKQSTIQFSPMRVESGKTLIYLYRESRFVGAINKAEIFFNNQYAGQLDNGSYCTYVTDPGPIEIKALEKIPAILVLRSLLSKLAGKQPIFEFTAEPDQYYFLEFNVAGYKVKQVSKDEALAKMGTLEAAKFSIDLANEDEGGQEKSPDQ